MIPSANNLEAWAAWADPVTTLIVGGAILVYIRKVLKPRLRDVEETQEERADRWEDQGVNSRERAVLIDDNAERVDQLEEVYDRLRQRVNRLERQFAAEHGVDSVDRIDSRSPDRQGDGPVTDGHGGIGGQPRASAWERDHPDLIQVRDSPAVESARASIHAAAERYNPEQTHGGES